ncbi:methylated-DNA--[protein]-cysteine S-methyltransferase [Gracilimonas mengyeensis]|uniref:Methylated-DNA--protein-cysteine methyltransferase n=1 Tax=Gracilimonas mengyeensis TaxID=1302730 RepID=A0A521EFL1_9BACT|nr:methylated-DNA--[protein]-cysteine S-methyltransferase [Gracilimonas mengyeensis]SMO82261.1 methylated-DNA-[protein]-cysteine S-methyltransferase [Gracilimonas mengyeensis]
MTYVSFFESPIGYLRILSNGSGITEIKFMDFDGPEDPDAHTESAKTQLREYFAGNRNQFQLNLLPQGSDFEQKIWKQLLEIPQGSTTSYGAIAKKIGDPKASQAVGKANGKNPIAIVIPCHRVIGSDNKLTGYAGGPERKEWLLKHEGALLI